MYVSNDNIKEILSNAIKTLFLEDSRIIFRKLKEEAINHRLAVYIENELKQCLDLSYLNVDLEYNKNYDSDKDIIRTDGQIKKIRPDILVHQRENNYNNKIAFECKINSLSKYDKEKLIALRKAPYNYENAIGIVYKPEKDYFFLYCVNNDICEKHIIEKNRVYI